MTTAVLSDTLKNNALIWRYCGQSDVGNKIRSQTRKWNMGVLKINQYFRFGILLS